MLQKVDLILDEALKALTAFNCRMSGVLQGVDPTPKVEVPLNSPEEQQPQPVTIPNPLPTGREEVKQLLTDLGVEFNTRAAMTTLEKLLREKIESISAPPEPAPEPEETGAADLFPAAEPAPTMATIDNLFAQGVQPEPEPVEEKTPDPDKVIEILQSFIQKYGSDPVYDILARFDCERFSELDPQHYATVLDAINKWTAEHGGK